MVTIGKSPLIEVQWRRGGIHLPEADLWLDPPFGVERAFVSHAHADHVARHRLTFCSEVTRALMISRFSMGKEGEMRSVGWDTVLEWGEWTLKLLPAGHIAGSAMLHLTRRTDGATLLYTGDFKRRNSLSSEACSLVRADTLIMESTFGLPQYQFPAAAELTDQLLKWVREALEAGEIPVLLGYSLGKAQEILCVLKALGAPVMLHSAVWKMTQALRPVLGDLLPERMSVFDSAKASGHVLVFPPSAAKSIALRKLKGCRTAMLTGWALQSGARYRYQVDEVFPLSDHADYPDLLRTVEEVEPRRIWLVHGHTRELGADLRRRGWEAWALGMDDQLELEITGHNAALLPAAPQTKQGPSAGAEAAGSAAALSRWAWTCEAVSAEASRQGKVGLLAEWLRALAGMDQAELCWGARFAAALVFEPADPGGPLQVGWALIRRVLLELSGVSEGEYRVISRSQNDGGRTAFLLLERAMQANPSSPTMPAGATRGAQMTLRELAEFFCALRSASGAMTRGRLLKERLAGLPPREGSWLVRLMLGDLRMGSREGLIEEAIAAAFEQPLEEVQFAMVLGGDPGQAAVLARAGRLREAQARCFLPLKVMLASPMETAAAIWEKLVEENEGGAPINGLWVEDKFDGIRAQIHANKGRVEIYSRDLKVISGQFPELVEVVARAGWEGIVDGEIVAHAEGKKLSFFDLQKRLGRRDQHDLFLPSDVSVRFVAFDLLSDGGECLLERPLIERRRRLEGWTWPEDARLALIAVERAPSAVAVEAAFLAARRRGNEGLIVKDERSTYQPGRRGRHWVKLKKAFATLDVVVVRVEQGHGRRSQVLSDYTFAVRDEASEGLRVIGKAYSGLTDAEIEELTDHFREHTLAERGRVREVVPNVVLEVAFDSIQASARHDSGLALRFPRIKAIRRDKSVREIDTLQHARLLAGLPSGFTGGSSGPESAPQNESMPESPAPAPAPDLRRGEPQST